MITCLMITYTKNNLNKNPSSPSPRSCAQGFPDTHPNPTLFKIDIMADSNELNTFDNKAYVKSDEADGNGNQFKGKNSSNNYGDKESLKENRFANLNSQEIRAVKKGKVYIY